MSCGPIPGKRGRKQSPLSSYKVFCVEHIVKMYIVHVSGLHSTSAASEMRKDIVAELTFLPSMKNLGLWLTEIIFRVHHPIC